MTDVKMPDPVECSCCLKLKEKIEALTEQLEERRQTVLNTEDKLSRMQKLFEMANKYAEELRTEVIKLNEEIQLLKKRQNRVSKNCDVSVQTDCDNLLSDTNKSSWNSWRNKVEAVHDAGDGENTSEAKDHASNKNEQVYDQELGSAWFTSACDDPEEGEILQEEPQSIADSLREAAEAAQKQTEFVFDEATGLYYDKSSGYYYDSERSLYYEPYSGIYYKYNMETNTYDYHSRVDFSQYTEEAYRRYYQNVTGQKRSKKKKSKKKKYHKEADKKERKRKSQDKLLNKYSQMDKKKPKLEPHSETSHDIIEAQEIKVSNKIDSINVDSSKSLTFSDKSAKSGNEDGYRCQTVISSVKEELDPGECKKNFLSSSSSSSDGIMEHPVTADDVRTQLDAMQMLTESNVVNQEDGEITSSASGTSSEVDSNDSETEFSSSEGSTSSEEVSALSYPPCLRLIVTESNSLDVGSLYIVPYTGATIGRDPSLSHLVLIPDPDVNKMHCTIQYNETEKAYTVINHATGDGTSINGHKLSEPPDKCEPTVVRNYDKLQLGATTFELHIHPGSRTCDDCEPGIIQAKLQQPNQESSQPVTHLLVDKETRRRQEMKKIRKRYGLADAPYIDRGIRYMTGYQDRSEIRRTTKGSDNPYQPDAEPASVNRAISQENKGHKLLAKLGWKEGESLGKSQQGIIEPIQAEIRSNQAAGLGSSSVSHHSLDNVRKMKATERWTKAQKRFSQLENKQKQEQTIGMGKSQMKPNNGSGNRLQFIQGKTETFSLETAETGQKMNSPASPSIVADDVKK